jgi:hypothetical protein
VFKEVNIMSETTICLKQYVNEEDNKKIEELKNICIEKEDMFLKFELDFKLNVVTRGRGLPKKRNLAIKVSLFIIILF